MSTALLPQPAIRFPHPHPPVSPGKTETTLEVLTFNIRRPSLLDGAHQWGKRRQPVMEVISANGGADVVGLQEALHEQIRELQVGLDRYGYVGQGRADGKNKGEHSAILYRKDRMYPLDQGTFWFSDTPEIPGTRHWGNSYVRVCSWARMRAFETGGTFWVFNSHWDHCSVVSRQKSARLLAQKVAMRGHLSEPVILTGDFNCEELSEPVQFLQGAEGGNFVDTYRAVRPHASSEQSATFHSFTGRPRGGKIDYILASGSAEVEDAEIVRHQRNGIWPSDHFPVRSRVVLR